jgi:hypothetical protein
MRLDQLDMRLSRGETLVKEYPILRTEVSAMRRDLDTLRVPARLDARLAELNKQQREIDLRIQRIIKTLKKQGIEVPEK